MTHIFSIEALENERYELTEQIKAIDGAILKAKTPNFLNRNRQEDLSILAFSFLHSLERSDVCYGSWCQDAKRPWGNSGDTTIAVDTLIETEVIESHEQFYALSTKDQTAAQEYAHDLYADLKEHMIDIWANM